MIGGITPLQLSLQLQHFFSKASLLVYFISSLVIEKIHIFLVRIQNKGNQSSYLLEKHPIYKQEDTRVKGKHSDQYTFVGIEQQHPCKGEALRGGSTLLFLVLYILFNKICHFFPILISWFLTTLIAQIALKKIH